MTDPPGVWARIGRRLRTQFIAGIIVMVPIGLTIWILVWLFSAIDNFLTPIIILVWGKTFPGVGFGITLLLVYVAGVIASNVGGRRLIHYFDAALARVPMVSRVYHGIKEILQSFSKPGQNGFMQVVFIEFPRDGMKAIGFITNESQTESGQKLLHVFIPTVPNPTTGFLELVTEDKVIRTKMSVDDGLKMILSAGKMSPSKNATLPDLPNLVCTPEPDAEPPQKTVGTASSI